MDNIKKKLLAIRSVINQFINNFDYNYFDECFSILIEELYENFELENANELYQKEIQFYLKYSQYDENQYLEKFKNNGYSLDIDVPYGFEDSYVASDFINVDKFRNEFIKEFQKLKFQ